MKRVSSYLPQGFTVRIRKDAEVADVLKGKQGIVMGIDDSDYPTLFTLAIDGQTYLISEHDLERGWV